MPLNSPTLLHIVPLDNQGSFWNAGRAADISVIFIMVYGVLIPGSARSVFVAQYLNMLNATPSGVTLHLSSANTLDSLVSEKGKLA